MAAGCAAAGARAGSTDSRGWASGRESARRVAARTAWDHAGHAHGLGGVLLVDEGTLLGELTHAEVQQRVVVDVVHVRLLHRAVCDMPLEPCATEALAEEELSLSVARGAGEDALSTRWRGARLAILGPEVPPSLGRDRQPAGRKRPLAPGAARLVRVDVRVGSARGGDDVIVLNEPGVLLETGLPDHFERLPRPQRAGELRLRPDRARQLAPGFLQVKPTASIIHTTS